MAIAIVISACQRGDLIGELPTIEPITAPPTATRQPSPTPWPTSTPISTATHIAQPTQAPDLTATWVAENIITLDLEISAEGVSFSYSDALYREIVPSRELPRIDGLRTLNEDALILPGVPDLIVFRGESDQLTSRPPLLVVQPIVDETGFFYPAYEIADQEYFNELRRVSITRPRLSFFFDREDFVVDAEYLDFANGKGISAIRYLPSSDQPEEITNRQLFYTFEGITENGDFYIWYQYPVQASALPDEETFTQNQLNVLAANEDNFSIYKVNEMEQVRRSLENGELTPSRSVLDELVSTIIVAETAGGRVATVVSTKTPLPQEAEIPAVDPAGTDTPETEQPATASAVTVAATEEPTATATPKPATTATVRPTATATENTPEETPTAAVTPTVTKATPKPSATPQIGAVPTYDPACANFVVYLEDVTIPDNTSIAGGEEFEKTWRVENKGSCPITSEFEVVTFADPGVVIVRAIPIGMIEAGESGLISIVLRAPDLAGKYNANVKLRAPDGTEFGQLFAIFIVP